MTFFVAFLPECAMILQCENMGLYAKNDTRKAIDTMKNTKFAMISKVLCGLLALTLMGTLVLPAQAASAGYKAGSITRRDDISVDYTQYLNGDVMYKLPDTIREDEEISIIVTTGEVALMDAYEASARTMSLPIRKK